MINLNYVTEAANANRRSTGKRNARESLEFDGEKRIKNTNTVRTESKKRREKRRRRRKDEQQQRKEQLSNRRKDDSSTRFANNLTDKIQSCKSR
jgi:hypothetical protein